MIEAIAKLARNVEQNHNLKSLVLVEELTRVHHSGESFPIYSFSIGSIEPCAPVMFVCGGVHGIERIGAQLAWSLLKSTMDRLIWDQALLDLLENVRLVIVPLLNPIGYKKFKRSNGNNVDLMRNSPVRAIEKVPFLVGGHRISPFLPWYQGSAEYMEEESKVIAKKFFSSTEKSPCVLSIDFHSGFGLRDRLWFPFSYTKAPFDQLPEMHAFTKLFEEAYPFHIYKIEPLSRTYLINGDLWDHLYLELKKINADVKFLPLTLEMGSWNWVKKNPWQLFSREGIFNPVKEHRLKRTYRRHTLLFDFMLRALYSHHVWCHLEDQMRAQHKEKAMERWY